MDFLSPKNPPLFKKKGPLKCSHKIQVSYIVKIKYLHVLRKSQLLTLKVLKGDHHFHIMAFSTHMATKFHFKVVIQAIPLIYHTICNQVEDRWQ